MNNGIPIINDNKENNESFHSDLMTTDRINNQKSCLIDKNKLGGADYNKKRISSDFNNLKNRISIQKKNSIRNSIFGKILGNKDEEIEENFKNMINKDEKYLKIMKKIIKDRGEIDSIEKKDEIHKEKKFSVILENTGVNKASIFEDESLNEYNDNNFSGKKSSKTSENFNYKNISENFENFFNQLSINKDQFSQLPKHSYVDNLMKEIYEIKQRLVDESIDMNKLKEIHLKAKKLLKKMKNHHKLITNSILLKSLSKFQCKGLKKSFEKNLIDINFIKSEKNPYDEHIDYVIYIYDKILKKTWVCKTRYSTLYKLHKEIKEKITAKNKRIYNFCGNNNQKIEIPNFPEKTIFENKDQNFLEDRMKGFQNYFQILITNINFKFILDTGIVTNFFYQLIWDYILIEKKNFTLSLKKWIDVQSSVISIIFILNFIFQKFNLFFIIFYYFLLFFIIFYYFLLFFIIFYYFLLFFIIFYYFLLFFIIFYYFLLFFIIFYYFLLFFIIFYYFLLFFIIFYYFLLFFIIFYYFLLFFIIF